MTDKHGWPQTSKSITGDCCGAWFTQCYQSTYFEIGADNSFTHFGDTNITVRILFDDGNIVSGTDAGWYGSWTAQVNGLSALYGTLIPRAVQVWSFCTNACGGLPAPAINVPGMFARYTGIRICPGQPLPVSVTYSSDQRTDVPLVLWYKQTPLEIRHRCASCGDCPSTWIDIDDNRQETKPLCALPCGFEIPTLPEPSCSLTVNTWCIFNDDNSIATTGVTQAILICDGVVSQSWLYTNYALDTQAGVTLTTWQYFADCDGNEIPEPSCELEFVSMHQRYDKTNVVIINWSVWIVSTCGGQPAYFSTVADEAIVFETSIAWTYQLVIASSIDYVNWGWCALEAWQIIGEPPIDINTLTMENWCIPIWEKIYKDTCTWECKYFLFKEDGQGNLAPYTLTWELVVDCDCTCELLDQLINGDCNCEQTKESCESFASCTVYKDFAHKAWSTSQATIDAVDREYSDATGTSLSWTWIDIGNGVEDLTSPADVNTNLESWINDVLGVCWFSAIPNPQTNSSNGSYMPAFMDLTYPTCFAWSFDIQNVPISYYNGWGPNYTWIRYSFDGTNFALDLIDAGWAVVASPITALGNVWGVPLTQC